MLCGWEGNRRSGVTLAMHHGLSGLSTYGLSGYGKGDEHPTYALEGHGTLYLTLPIPTTLLRIQEYNLTTEPFLWADHSYGTVFLQQFVKHCQLIEAQTEHSFFL